MARYKTRALDSVNEIILHCSATPTKMDIGVKEIRDWHMNDNGWVDIGYHYVIRRNGEIEVGRPVYAVGAHCAGHNQRTIGICLIGGGVRGEDNNFTEPQFKSLAKLIHDIEKTFDIEKIVGHCYYNPNKSCPVFGVAKFKREYNIKP